VAQAQEATRAGLDEIRRIARRLRPGVLEELGLPSALRALAEEFTGKGLTVRPDLGPALPPLPAETELVLYRVAQEALTNTARHSGAERAEVRLRADADGTVELLVRDDGKGVGDAPEGAGISGMRERALLVGATLTVVPAPGGGTDVRLRIPQAERILGAGETPGTGRTPGGGAR
jgi:two-component system sensor histidine kinase UhpB